MTLIIAFIVAHIGAILGGVAGLGGVVFGAFRHQQANIVDTGCDWTKPLTASTADTPDTKREILAFDLARQKNCPGK